MGIFREKKIYCGSEYLEVDIIPNFQLVNKKAGTRSKKQKVSAPKQRNLNDKNAKRYFRQIGNTNFTKDDLHLTATYADKFLPKTVEEAEKEAAKYIRRISYRMKKEGLPPLKYMLVTECRTSRGDDTKPIRIHHHIIINKGLDRDIIESLWCKRKKKGQRQGERIGFVNADRLQPNEFGIEGLCRYLSKDPKGKKRWSCSQNLEKPYCRTNDHRYSKREVERAAKCPDDKGYWEKKYKGYIFTECKPVYNELTGWSLYLKLRRLRC